LGYLRCREWTCFHALKRLDRPTVPRLLRSEFIPSCLLSPTEFLRSTSRRTLFGLACPAWVCSLFATLPRRPRAPGEHLLPIRSVPGLSQPLDGLLRLRFCGLIASRYHVQGSSTVQGFLPARSLPGSSPVRASVTLPPSCSPASRLPHRGASPSRPCSAVRSVLRGRGLASLSVAPLFGFLSSSRYSTAHRVPDSPGHPLTTLPARSLLGAVARNPSVKVAARRRSSRLLAIPWRALPVPVGWPLRPAHSVLPVCRLVLLSSRNRSPLRVEPLPARGW